MFTAELIKATSAASNVTSCPVTMQDGVKDASIVVFFTGSNVVGTLVLQGNNDGTNWVTLPSSSQSITSSAAYAYADRTIPFSCYKQVRVNWTATSGTGNISAQLYARN